MNNYTEGHTPLTYIRNRFSKINLIITYFFGGLQKMMYICMSNKQILKN